MGSVYRALASGRRGQDSAVDQTHLMPVVVLTRLAIVGRFRAGSHPGMNSGVGKASGGKSARLSVTITSARPARAAATTCRSSGSGTWTVATSGSQPVTSASGTHARHGGNWPSLTSAAVPVTLPSRIMVFSAPGWPSTYRSKKASVTRTVRRSTGLVPSYGARWLAPNRSR
jgi:hypothetical protein